MATSLRFLTTNLIESASTSLMNGPAVSPGTVHECASGVAAITRAGGSFITAGVRPGALLSGAIAARFPATTYVLAVAAPTLTMSAQATSSTAGAEAATFTPYNARDEVSPYLMENAMDRERRKLWQQNSGAAMAVDFDLGSDIAVTVAMLAGYRDVVGAGVTTCVVKSSAASNGYPPAAGSSWTTRATLSNPGRDLGAVFGSASARWWRWDFTSVASAFTLGKFVLGVFNYDLGILHSPGASVLGISPNVEERTVGQDPVVSYVGDDRELFSLPYRNVLSAKVTTLDTLRKLRRSFIMADKDDVFREVIVQRGELPHTWDFHLTSDIVSGADFALEQLG